MAFDLQAFHALALDATTEVGYPEATIQCTATYDGTSLTTTIFAVLETGKTISASATGGIASNVIALVRFKNQCSQHRKENV